MITYTQAYKILYYNFGQVVYTVPNFLYIGLSTQNPGNAGTNAVEPVGGNYARVEYPNTSSAYWSEPINGVMHNQNTITFQTSSEAWGNITYVFISDSLTGGNILYYEALNSTMYVDINTTVQFLPAALEISIVNPEA